MNIPFIDLKSQYEELGSQINSRIQDVLNHGQYIMGPEVEELEERLADFVGASHCVTVASGTEALLISLMAIGVGPGDEVITTPFTFIATAEVVVLLGAKPVFVDVDPDTCNIDATLIENKITDKTKAIIPVSLYGQPSDMDEINKVAEKFGIAVIEDAAQSFGAEYKGKKSCNLSRIGCTSFFPSKPLGCYGDGGAIFTSDDELAEICRQIRVHGQSGRYFHSRVGLGGRMDTLQCAILLPKLEAFSEELEKRRDNATLYSNELSTRFRLQKQISLSKSSWGQFTIFLKDRDRIREVLASKGVPTAVHYPRLVTEQPAYTGLCCVDCTPNAAGLVSQCLSLPFSPYISETQILQVSAALGAAADESDV